MLRAGLRVVRGSSSGSLERSLHLRGGKRLRVAYRDQSDTPILGRGITVRGVIAPHELDLGQGHHRPRPARMSRAEDGDEPLGVGRLEAHSTVGRSRWSPAHRPSHRYRSTGRLLARSTSGRGFGCHVTSRRSFTDSRSLIHPLD